MRVSLNEIETTVRKATVGAGWPWGAAEDAGRAAAWLAARGLEGATAAREALREGPAPVRLAPIGDGRWRCPRARILAEGIAALDLLLAGDALRVELGGADAPLLLLGLAGVMAGACGAELALLSGGRPVARVCGATLHLGGTPPGAWSRVELRAGAAEPEGAVEHRAPLQPGDAGWPVDAQTWAALATLAARCLVPASEISRLRGAGAGLVDDD